MSKKVLFFIILGLVIIAAIGALKIMAPANPDPGTPTTGGIRFRDFLPFGNKPDPVPNEEVPGENPNEEPIVTPNNPEENTAPIFSQIVPTPVAGFTVLERIRKVPGSVPEAVETKEVVRYVDAITGHISDVFPDTGATEPVTNQTIPGIHRAEFGNAGTSLVANYLKPDGATVETMYGKILTDIEGNGAIQADVLPKDTLDFSVSPDGKKFFYLFRFDTGSVGNTIAFDTKTKSTIFESPFVEWTSQWAGPEQITLTTKASGTTNGFSYSLNPTTKALTRILGNVSGLTALYGPSSDNALYASGSQNGLNLYAYKQKGNAAESAPFSTLPKKCVFATETKVYCAVPNSISTNLYPDSWYQGRVSFDDSFYLLDLGSFSQSLVGNPSVEGESVDAVDLKVNKAGTMLVFRNKKDGTLWKMDLSK